MKAIDCLIAQRRRENEERELENKEREAKGLRRLPLLSLGTLQGDKVLSALCRLAGLRLGEARELPWSGKAADSEGQEHGVGVDWERQRLCLVGNHKGQRGRKYREVPICRRLEQLLTEAFEVAEPGAVTVTGLSGNNLHKRAGEYCTAATVKKWPGFFQAMRSSCKNDWKVAGFAEPTYTTWAGHSPEVSRKHYVVPTEQEFHAAIGS